MLELSEMSRFLMDKLASLQSTFEEISVKKEEPHDEVDLGVHVISDEERDEAMENYEMDTNILEPTVKIEEVDNNEDLISDANETINEIEKDIDDQLNELKDEEMEDVKEEEDISDEAYPKRDMNVKPGKFTKNKSSKDLTLQNGPIVPPGWSWKAKPSHGGSNRKSSITYKSPHGRTFY